MSDSYISNNPQERGFLGVNFPRGFWEAKGLNLNEKALFLEIEALAKAKGYCYAKNSRLASHIGTSPKNLSNMIGKLEAKGLIRVEMLTDGGAFIERRLFTLKSHKDFTVVAGKTDKLDGFTGLFIPVDIWTNQALTIIERAMLSLIVALSDEVRGCYAANSYFARRFGKSPKHVSEIISNLSNHGYVKVIQIRKEELTVERQIHVLTLDHLAPVQKKRDSRRTVLRTSEMGGVSKMSSEGSLEGIQNVLRTPPKCHEQIDSLKEPKIKNTIDTARSAGVSESFDSFSGKSLKSKSEVGQAEESLVKQQSEGEADSQIDYKAVQESFNTILGDRLKPVKKLTNALKKNIFDLTNLTAVKEKIKTGAGAAEALAGVFRAAAECPYLLGENDREWKSDFAWIVSPDHAEAILEGRYKPRKSAAQITQVDPDKMAAMIASSMNDY